MRAFRAVVVMLLSTLLLSSCTPAYYPATPVVAPFTEAGQAEVGGFYGFAGIDGHVAVSVTDHLFVGGAASYADSNLRLAMLRVGRRYAEGIAGWYTTSDTGHRNHAINAGWGHGAMWEIPGRTRTTGPDDSTGADHFGTMNRWFLRYGSMETHRKGNPLALLLAPNQRVPDLPGTMEYGAAVTLAYTSIENLNPRGPERSWYLIAEANALARYAPAEWLAFEGQAGFVLCLAAWHYPVVQEFWPTWFSMSAGMVVRF